MKILKKNQFEIETKTSKPGMMKKEKEEFKKKVREFQVRKQFLVFIDVLHFYYIFLLIGFILFILLINVNNTL